MKNSTLLQNATGPVEYKLTNDYLFRAVFQKNTHVLKGLICSLLYLKEAEIQSVEIQNPIKLGESFEEKDIILDLNILLNNAQRLNIEMQVCDLNDWPERSLYYLCRAYCSLNKGDDYIDVLPTIHIGILNFTLFPDEPEFYSKNLMTNIKTHKVYSSKFALNVLDLKSINLATNEDKACKLDYWANLFKATTWEEIRMLAEQNHFVHEAAVTMRELTADEKIRLQCEARERYELDQRSTMASGIRKGKQEQKEIDDAIKDAALAEKDTVIFEKDTVISAKDKEIDKLRKLLKTSSK